MFNFFKKKDKYFKIDNNQLCFFKNIVAVLPEKYFYLKPQVNEEFILGFKKNILGFNNSYTFILNSNLEMNYLNKLLPNYFILENIRLWNESENKFFNLELDIINGYLGGFKLESINFSDFNIEKTDVDNIFEKYFEVHDFDIYLKNLTEYEKKLITENTSQAYLVELPEGKFSFFDNIGNGDIVALNENVDCFILTHDPYKINKIFSKHDFILKLEDNSLKNNLIKIYDKLIEKL